MGKINLDFLIKRVSDLTREGSSERNETARRMIEMDSHLMAESEGFSRKPKDYWNFACQVLAARLLFIYENVGHDSLSQLLTESQTIARKTSYLARVFKRAPSVGDFKEVYDKAIPRYYKEK
jgi:hypothetical protein